MKKNQHRFLVNVVGDFKRNKIFVCVVCPFYLLTSFVQLILHEKKGEKNTHRWSCTFLSPPFPPSESEYVTAPERVKSGILRILSDLALISLECQKCASSRVGVICLCRGWWEAFILWLITEVCRGVNQNNYFAKSLYLAKTLCSNCRCLVVSKKIKLYIDII